MSSRLRSAAHSWNSGYSTDVPYTTRAHKQMSPITLCAVAGLKGLTAPDLSQPFTYLDLGCGNGVSVAAHAALYPLGRFYGIDFMPEHIAFARALAKEANLNNIELHESDFASVADAPEGRWPQFDFIVMHGVLSWISDENRAHVLRIVRRYLKTGGMVYGSYNCQPGWGGLLPVRQMVHTHAARNPGERADRQTVAGLNYVQQLLETGTVFEHLYPQVRPAVEYALDPEKNAYLSHEWLNRDMHTPFSVQMIDEMAAAKCTYIGSADPGGNVNVLAYSKHIREQADALKAGDRETVADFVNGRQFRQDIYGRGCIEMSGTRRERFNTQFAFGQFGDLPQPEDLRVPVDGPADTIAFPAMVFAPILWALRAGKSVCVNAYAHVAQQDPSLGVMSVNERFLAAWQQGMLAPLSPQAEQAEESCAAFAQVVDARQAAGDMRLNVRLLPKFGIPVT